jgi:hypothetical protein
VITGFNTDIEFGGIVYHVQTEDKGVDTPLILTLVYTGGAILASKRALYDDLLEDGFDESVLAERLARQHKLICAAVAAGRIEDLKKMSSRDAEARAAQTVKPEMILAPTPASTPPPIEQSPPAPSSEEGQQPPPVLADPQGLRLSPPMVQSAGGYAALSERVNHSKNEESGARPILELVNERRYLAGDAITLLIRLHGAAESLAKMVVNAPVGVKILGTTFRPLILSARTDDKGMASVSVTLPHFTSGRAAILIRAAVGGETLELRRMIHHA